MRIALVNSMPHGKIYPLALLKIGAWRKSLGDTCELFDDRLPKAGEFDEIWITTVFTFDIPHAVGMVREAKNRAGRVLVGGVSATLLPEKFEDEGVEVHRGLIPDAEAFSPDYSLLGFAPEYSISHTSRGCVRRCGFCMVHRLEPEFGNRRDWVRDIHQDTKKVLFFDNNWLAKDIEDVKQDVSTMRALVDAGRITSIDFNQGLDARLMTEELADLLEGVPIKPVRFAFDGMQEDGHYQRAVRMMAARGFHNFMSYVLYNFKDTPEDFYYRLRESVMLACELGVSVGSFPMRFQPILDIDKGRDYVGKHWADAKKKGFMTILQRQSIGGGVTFNIPSEFEYWFGKDADEFNRLLSYPKLRQLIERKKGALRIERARA